MTDTFDRVVKLGPITMARWICGRDAWASDLVEDDGYLIHNSEPRFIARWRVGEPARVSGVVYVDDADDDGEPLALYDFIWIDPMPGMENFRLLMRSAIDAVDHFIEALGEEYD